MTTLLEIQDRFAADLIDDTALGNYVVWGNVSANQLLNIYRNNFFSVHCTAIRETFPCIERLVGHEYLQHLARKFILEVPHTNGGLQDFGRNFSDFLRHNKNIQNLPYLADIAKLEWAMSESANAANLAAFDPAQLHRYPEDGYPDLHAVMHPAFRLLCSEFPVYDIWSLREKDDVSDISSDGQCIAVCRVNREVYLRLLSHGQAALLQELVNGKSLAVAVETALAREAELNVVPFINTCVHSGFFLDLKNKWG